MKNIVIVAVLLVLIVVVIALGGGQQQQEQLLRIHIRANSNQDCDQRVKYAVKQAVVDYLVPYIAQCNDVTQAMSVVSSNVDNICDVANQVLLSYGYAYGTNVRLCQEDFPLRSYHGVQVPSGVYDALIVELGQGKGDNWWCVVYPPLCFVGAEGSGDSIVYQSKLWQIIQQWRQNN